LKDKKFLIGKKLDISDFIKNCEKAKLTKDRVLKKEKSFTTTE
jgi:hypothetical protein